MKLRLRTPIFLFCLAVVVPSCGSDSSSAERTTSTTTTSTTSRGTPTSAKQPSDAATFLPSVAPAVESADCGTLATVFEKQTQDAITASRMRCGTLKVPVDHAKPKGPEISIAFGRLVATGPQPERLGTLIVNPGGPGGSGIEYLATGINEFPAELTSRFDIVAFDPRGVGASTQLTCLSQADLKQLIEAEPIKDPERAAAAALRDERHLRSECVAKNNDLFLHIGTDQVVADLEDLRLALGNEPLNFYGMSYGTVIAAGYASRYPDHVRAVVLDGSLPPDRSLATRTIGQAKSMTRAFASFAKRCTQVTICPLNPDPEAATTAVLKKFRDGTTLPAALPGAKPFDADELERALITALYEPLVWDATADAIVALTGSDPVKQAMAVKMLSGFAAQQTGKRKDGTYDNSIEVRFAVTCADAAAPITRSEGKSVNAKIAKILRGTPLEDPEASDQGETCTQMPTGNQLRIEQTGLGTRALVIGNTNDPVTPIEFAREMARALGDVPLISYDGNGHTAGLRVDCVTSQLVNFFVTGGAGFVAQNCTADLNEFDVYQVLESSFADGWSADAKTCAINRIRRSVTPLELLSTDADQTDGPVVEAIRRAAAAC